MKAITVKRFAVAVVAAVSIAGSAPAMAAGSQGTRGVRVQRPPMADVERPRAPNMQSRIPAPLPQPVPPPVINGPVGPSGMPPMGNGL